MCVGGCLVSSPSLLTGVCSTVSQSDPGNDTRLLSIVRTEIQALGFNVGIYFIRLGLVY